MGGGARSRARAPVDLGWRQDLDAERRGALEALDAEHALQEEWATQVRRAVALMEWPAFVAAFGAERDRLVAAGDTR